MTLGSKMHHLLAALSALPRVLASGTLLSTEKVRWGAGHGLISVCD